MANFVDILSTPMDDIKPPKTIPVGQYLAILDGPPEQKELGQNESPALVFKVRLLSPIHADEDELHEALNGRMLSEIPITFTQFLNGNGMFRLKIFLQDHLGIGGKGSLGEKVAMSAGREFVANITHRTLPNGGIIANITGTARSPSLAA